MESYLIKFKTFQLINGTKHMSEQYVESVCYLVCHELGIEKCEDNFVHIREACKTYYELNIGIN